ncbi:glycine receptor subunit alpha-2-like [Octopus sinensis]|uniref:Gamma-aminobutyric acid receptor subunit beta n=1 Tax=Octopus sinensis TaxID=2607531 RepID=A0A6P7SZM9_9MOLL|nr:glycine receptor subunit alpha-2-like [Octopus sinensis]
MRFTAVTKLKPEMNIYWSIVFTVSITVQSVSVSKTDFLQTILDSYDSSISPNFDNNEPTVVKVKLHVNSFDSVTESSMDYSLNALITQEWTDKRLDFYDLIDAEYLELDAKLIHKIWVPDLYFPNEKYSYFHDVTVQNKMLHVYDKGQVIYKARISLTASCPMDLRRYPMDTQVCSLYMESFAYSKRSVIFLWAANPLSLSKNLILPHFRILKHAPYECDPTMQFDSGNFSCLELKFTMKRNLGYYMIQIYIPSIFIVVISWVSFWLNVDAVPARISLGILTVLTMTTQKTSAITTLPKVSYIKAIDVWMAACLCFVFAALLEFAFVNILDRHQLKKFMSMRTAAEFSDSIERNDVIKRNPNARPLLYTKGFRKARRIDIISRFLFPCAFAGFCVCYWLVYNINSGTVGEQT